MGDFKTNYDALLAAIGRVVPIPALGIRPSLPIDDAGVAPFFTELRAFTAGTVWGAPETRFEKTTYGVTYLRAVDTAAANFSDARPADTALRLRFGSSTSDLSEVVLTPGVTLRWTRGARKVWVLPDSNSGFSSRHLLIWHTDPFSDARSVLSPAQIQTAQHGYGFISAPAANAILASAPLVFSGTDYSTYEIDFAGSAGENNRLDFIVRRDDTLAALWSLSQQVGLGSNGKFTLRDFAVPISIASVTDSTAIVRNANAGGLGIAYTGAVAVRRIIPGGR